MKKMQKLGGAIILLSEGIPFFQCGQEICRTKKGDENSYNKDDSINEIDWTWKETYNDVFQYYRGLISLRKAHGMQNAEPMPWLTIRSHSWKLLKAVSHSQ